MVASLHTNIEAVEERIAGACARSGRRREEITLIAVTKVFPSNVIREAYDAGLREFGENYVQEFEAKRVDLAGLEEACFHLIGHLQSNKARRAADMFQVIQTVDRAKLARRLNEYGRSLDVMIEVKLSPEESKRGADPDAVPGLIESISQYRNLRLLGLMTMPPWSTDPETLRPYFARLREMAGRFSLPSLSMGMSNDFEVAIAEGATHIRVGSALFGPRPKKR